MTENQDNEVPPTQSPSLQAKDATAEKITEPDASEKHKELTTKEAYFASLNAWVKHANISQNAMALFPYYLFSSYPQIFQNQAATPVDIGLNGQIFPTAPQMPNGRPGGNAAGGAAVAAPAAAQQLMRTVILNEQLQAEIIQLYGGYEHVIAPFWKRAIAELVDVIILLLLKVMITFTIMNVFDLDLGFEFDKEVLKKSLEDDYAGFLAISSDFLAFSSDLLVLEILTKVIVCFYEAIWTRQGGATPGKMLLGLRIVYMEAMVPLQPPQPPQLGFRTQRVQLKALLYPAETPGFKRAFMRAVAKNVLMTLLFPMCFVMIFFKNNRTAYDFMTKTIVIEDNPNAVLRRQR